MDGEFKVIPYTMVDRDMLRDIHNKLFKNGFVKQTESNTSELITLKLNCTQRHARTDGKANMAAKIYHTVMTTLTFIVLVITIVTKLMGRW